MRTTPFSVLAVSLAACAADVIPEGPAGDGGRSGVDAALADAAAQVPDAGGPLDASEPPCVVDVPLRATASAGGRVRLPRRLDGDALELTPPAGWAVVETGTTAHLRLPYGIEGEHRVTLTRRCPGSEATAELVVDVRALRFTALPAWTDGVDGPSAREHPMLFIDPRDPDRLLLYGGYAFRPRQYTLVTDLWAYDLGADRWTTLTSSDAPIRGGGRLVTVPGERSAVYLGGADAQFRAQLAIDRLDLDGDAGGVWTRLPLTRGPGSRATQLGSLVRDARHDRIISACGIDDTNAHCQVAAYDLAQGTYDPLTPAGDSPSARYGVFAAHDTENDRLIMFSGAQDGTPDNPINAAGDTWALELAEDPPRWVKLVDTSTSVIGRRNGCTAYDPIGQRMFVWGGTADGRTTARGLFAIDLLAGHAAITRVEVSEAKPVRSSCSAIYDGARRRILFGFGNTTGAIFADFVALEL